MNTIKKVLCIALVIVMSLSIFVFPASALDYSITVDLEDTVVGVDSSGNKLHRIVAYVDSSHSLYALQLSISYPKAAFYPVNATTLKKLPAPGTNAFDKKSTDIIFNANADVYAEYLEDGYYYGDDVNADAGYAYFASDVSPTYAKMGDVALNDTTNYAGFYWTFATDFGDNYLIPSGGKESSAESPIRGRVAVCAVYLAEQANATEGTYEIGVHATQKTTVSGTYVTTDVIDSLSIGTDMKSITSGVTYNNAVITIGEDATPLELSYWKDQIRFDKKSNGEYAGKFDYRILASIDNFDEVYADVAAAEASIKDVGFIFNKGAAIDEATAKAQVEGGAATYSQVKNVYVSTYFSAEKGYVMSCMVENIPDADVGTSLSAMAYVIYEQNGETMYAYSPVQTSTFTTLYNTYYSQAFPA